MIVFDQNQTDIDTTFCFTGNQKPYHAMVYIRGDFETLSVSINIGNSKKSLLTRLDTDGADIQMRLCWEGSAQTYYSYGQRTETLSYRLHYHHLMLEVLIQLEAAYKHWLEHYNRPNAGLDDYSDCLHEDFTTQKIT